MQCTYSKAAKLSDGRKTDTDSDKGKGSGKVKNTGVKANLEKAVFSHLAETEKPSSRTEIVTSD